MGLTYEEFTEGRRWVTQGRTVTEADVMLFCGVSGRFQPAAFRRRLQRRQRLQ